MMATKIEICVSKIYYAPVSKNGTGWKIEISTGPDPRPQDVLDALAAVLAQKEMER